MNSRRGLAALMASADAAGYAGAALFSARGLPAAPVATGFGDGRALVSTEGLAPQHLEVLPGAADARVSTTAASDRSGR